MLTLTDGRDCSWIKQLTTLSVMLSSLYYSDNSNNNTHDCDILKGTPCHYCVFQWGLVNKIKIQYNKLIN